MNMHTCTTETLTIIAQLAPMTVTLRTLQLANVHFRLSDTRQHLARTQFRILQKYPKRALLVCKYVLPNGSLDGPRMTFYCDGRCHNRIYYMDDVRHGASMLWWANGRIDVRTTYRGNVVHGTYTSWYTCGQLFTIRNFNNGYLHGELTNWRSDGQVDFRRMYNNGKLVRCH